MHEQPVLITPNDQSPLPATAPIAPPPPVTPPIKVKHAHTFIFGYIALVIFAAALGGIYSWQHTKLNDANVKVASLQGQVTKLSSNSGTFTYKPDYGIVSVTLPRSYGVVRENDGCPCDNPYISFEILPRISNTVLNNDPTQYAGVNVFNSYNGDLSSALATEETRLHKANLTVLDVSNTTVDSIAAKHIVTNQNGNEFLLGTGKWLVQIIINGSQSSSLQNAILRGIVIKQ
jgi:hypothetical protein